MFGFWRRVISMIPLLCSLILFITPVAGSPLAVPLATPRMSKHLRHRFDTKNVDVPSSALECEATGCNTEKGVVYCSADEEFGSGKCLVKDMEALRNARKQGEAMTPATRTHTLQFLAPHVQDRWPAPTVKGAVALVPGKIYTVDNFISPAEVDSLVERTRQQHLHPGGVGMGPTPYCEFRKSVSWSVASGEADNIVPGIAERMGHLAAAHPRNFESMQVTRYDKGGFYTDHVDAEMCADQVQKYEGETREEIVPEGCVSPGRRAHTVLIYLTSNDNDGSTYFPNLNVRVYPKKGRAILFHPTTPSGLTDMDMVHGSEEDSKGGKLVIQQWIGHGADSI